MAVQTTRRQPSRQPDRPTASRSGSWWRWLGFLLPIGVIAALVVAGNLRGEPGSDVESRSAPPFTLPATDGTEVALDGLLAEGDTLLYFSMGVGCDGCFAQIPEAIDGLAERGVNLVSVMVDPPDRVAAEALRFGITVPILIDRDRAVSAAYGMLGVYGHSDRPSHSFALVRADGTVEWVKHYSTMFVPLAELLGDMGMA